MGAFLSTTAHSNLAPSGLRNRGGEARRGGSVDIVGDRPAAHDSGARDSCGVARRLTADSGAQVVDRGGKRPARNYPEVANGQRGYDRGVLSDVYSATPALRPPTRGKPTRGVGRSAPKLSGYFHSHPMPGRDAPPYVGLPRVCLTDTLNRPRDQRQTGSPENETYPSTPAPRGWERHHQHHPHSRTRQAAPLTPRGGA